MVLKYILQLLNATNATCGFPHAKSSLTMPAIFHSSSESWTRIPGYPQAT